MTTYGKGILRTAVFVAMIMLTALFTAAPMTHAAGPAPAAVDHSVVCMVNDAVMSKPQIPVEVAGKTYYGCCKMCVGKLQGSDAARTAIDPITGKRVDKATAYIIRGENDAALYFESADTARRYMAERGTKGKG